jgi:hypothetical protein
MLLFLFAVLFGFSRQEYSSAMTYRVFCDCVVRSATERGLGGLIDVHDHWGCKK